MARFQYLGKWKTLATKFQKKQQQTDILNLDYTVETNNNYGWCGKSFYFSRHLEKNISISALSLAK